MSPRRLAATVLAATALSAGPAALFTAASADAAPNYSVSVEYCKGGVSVLGYGTVKAATTANAHQVARQLGHPGVLRSVQLRHGSKVIKASTIKCAGVSMLG